MFVLQHMHSGLNVQPLRPLYEEKTYLGASNM